MSISVPTPEPYDLIQAIERHLLGSIDPSRELPPDERDRLLTEAREEMLLGTIERCTQTLRAYRQRLVSTEATQFSQPEQRALKAHADRASKHGRLSVLGYARMKGLPTRKDYLQELGRTATRIARRDGMEPGKVPDQRYGTVNSYPISVLDEAAESLKSFQ